MGSITQPIPTDATITKSDSQTLAGSNATVVTPIFRIVGSVEIYKLWAVITTALGTNHTAAYWRLNDQTAQPAITLATGTTLSAAPVGSMMVKKGLVSAALTLLSGAAGVVSEPTALETFYYTPFTVVAKNGANTDIEYVYTTTETPTSGVIQHFIEYSPRSAGATVTPQ